MKPDIVFYQQYAVPYFGILALNGHLRQKGFKADLIIDSLEKDVIKTLKSIEPEVIGISAMSTEHTWLIKRINLIKEAIPEVKIIVGGVHAIFYPVEILKSAPVDIVCHSEGEEVLVKLLEELVKSSPDLSKIDGIAYSDKSGEIHLNDRAMLVPFNDEIIEDRDIYYNRYPQIAQDEVHRFFSSRGCPYKCSFCYNANIHDIFHGKGKYVRQKSVSNFLNEIELQHKKYSMKSVFFYDDLFTFDKKWLAEFLIKYKEKINVPFMCTTRANLIDENTVKILKDAGCRTVSFGVETGTYEIRSKILKKDISDQKIIECGNLFNKYGVKVQTANMFCLPDETVKDALKTIEINIKTKTDFAFSALFMPFPKTAITEYCISKGYLKSDYDIIDMPASFLTDSVLKIPDKKKIMNVHFLSYFFIKHPFLFKTFKWCVRISFFNKIYYYIFLLSNLLRHKGERGISFFAAIRFAWRLRKSFKGND